MAIKLESIEPLQVINPEDHSMGEELFATLRFLRGGESYAALRVPLAELPDDWQVGETLKLAKAE